MKILKFNENSNKNDPKVGDYVICNFVDGLLPLKFANNNIGEIIDIDINKFKDFPYIIKYKNLPRNLQIYSCNNSSPYEDIIFSRRKILV